VHFVGLPVLFLGCQKSAPAPSVAKAAAADTVAPNWGDSVPQDREANDTARFLAGMPGNPGSQFAAMEADQAWQEHRKLMDAAWARADEKLIRGLHEFQHSELSAEPFARNVLFYPFSGPDALTATICFPESATLRPGGAGTGGVAAVSGRTPEEETWESIFRASAPRWLRSWARVSS
jgi:hypothetical protein